MMQRKKTRGGGGVGETEEGGGDEEEISRETFSPPFCHLTAEKCARALDLRVAAAAAEYTDCQ